ncbi:oxidation resistance protein 1 [Coemansia biformis]|uniref:Oxidation resistance protein 1 n=1 Tax=Coemansia biformis TaxID=1286918 RepID=A0A9W7Y445_9FUNG|nr:oxidation resistance protein 1 [Coemansia biformis]
MQRRYSGEPLACVSATVVECRPTPGPPADENDCHSLQRRSSLSSRASSAFDIYTFPLAAESSLARNEFEAAPAPLSPRLGAQPPQTAPAVLARASFSVPASLVMDLRKYSGGSAGSRSCSQESLPPSLSSASDASGEHDTAGAAREAMDTPLPRAQAPAPAPPPRQQSRPVQLLARDASTPKALTEAIAAQLRLALPVQQRLAKSWRLVYSMDQHGISMNTMLERCAGEKALVLAIKDTSNRVFGAFLNETLRLSPTFYGQGTSLLWKAFRSSPQSRKKDAVKCFKYSGENEYFILCDPGFVAIGGGRGKFGLWFKDDFLHGSTAHCPTFNNQPLCLDPAHPKNADPDAQQEFTVGHLELWGFDA